MSSYITIELITTPPQLEIIMPNYCKLGGKLPIVIKSNRLLSPLHQDIYLRDIEGNIQPLSLTYNDYSYEGSVVVSNLAVGVATLHVQLRDEVYNPSEIITKPVHIISFSPIVLDLWDTAYNPLFATKSRELDTNTEIQDVGLEDRSLLEAELSSRSNIEIEVRVNE